MSEGKAAQVDERAVVAPGARLGAGVAVGPFAVIGDAVTIGDGCLVGPHCVVEGPTEIGPGCRLVAHVSMGLPPQDLKYGGEPTRLQVGARNTFREFVTVHRGTGGGGGLTAIGDDNLFMAYSHVAHDCRVGTGVVFANAATLAGHVEVGDGVTLGAFSAVHQFCRVGRQAFVGGFTVLTQDVLPYMKTVGVRGAVRAYGPNRIGLLRRGFDAAAIDGLATAFKRLRRPGGRQPEALARLRAEFAGMPEVVELADFVAAAARRRGVHL